MRSRYLLTQLIAVAFVMMPVLSHAVPILIRITKLEAPPELPAQPSNLNALTAGLSLDATATDNPEQTEARLVLQILRNGQPGCGATVPARGLSVRLSKQMHFDGQTLATAFSACRQLEPAAYSVCARFYDYEGVALSDEYCTEFRVANMVAGSSYQAPVNLSPADHSFELEEQFKKGLRFSWKGVEPGYQGQLTYQLRVWTVPDGMDENAAIIERKPLLTRDIVDATETTLTNALPLSDKSGKPVRFAWNVQALNAEGQPVGANNGSSAVFALTTTTYAIRLDKISVACTSTPGIYSFSFSLTNINIGTAKLTNFLATGSIPAGAAITAFTPPLSTIIPAGAQITITGTLNASPGLSNVCIGAQITDVGNSFWQASKDTCIPVQPCKCEACDPKKVSIALHTSTVTINGNNTLNLVQPISITTTPVKLIKGVDAELIYFAFTPDNDDCMTCNKDSRTFGNFLSGTIGNAGGTGGGAHSLGWTFSPPKNGSGITPFNTVISLPPMLKCCAATARFCIRYVIRFADCTVCYKIACYEKRVDGCSGNNVPSTPNN